MNNELTTTSGLVNYNPGKATLLEMRADSKRFPRLKDMTREEAVFGKVKIVSQAFLYRGQTADQANIQFISNSLVTELLEDKRFGAAYISLAEIQVVVKRAILGSDMFGISVSSLYKVIMEFVKGEGHQNQVIVANRMREAREKAFNASGLSPMIQAFTGEFIRNNQTK